LLTSFYCVGEGFNHSFWGSADFDNSEVSDKLHNKKFAKISSCSQDIRANFLCKQIDKISERNYYGEKFDGVTVCTLVQTKRNTKTLNRQ